MEQLVIWILGSSGVGKTTLARKIHSFMEEMGGSKTELVKESKEGIDYCYTRCSNWSANLGKLLPDVKCSGTDTLGTKDQIRLAFQKVIEDGVPIVIIEGIMATMQWREFIKSEVSDNLLYVIHLDTTEEVNFERLRHRRAEKKGTTADKIVLEDKTLDNLRGKIRGFSSLYRRLAYCVDYKIQIQTDNLNEQQIFEIVKKDLLRILTDKH